MREGYQDKTAELAVAHVMKEQKRKMFKSCSKCGRIHEASFKCNAIKRTYKEIDEERHLRSQYSWTKKSAEIRERSHFLCEVCRDKGFYTYDNLEVHHIVKVKDDKDKLLDNYNLICLCQEHHKQADSGRIDVDYLKELARHREDD